MDLKLSEDVRQKIYSLNALRLLKMDAAPA